MSTRLHVPGPRARELLARDRARISPSYPRDYPFVMSHGKGSEVWDVDGNRYVDFAAGIAVNATGHCHPEVVHAIQEQANKFIHISSDYYHLKMIELAEKLNEIRPMGEEAEVFFNNSGTEAVETAMKLSRYVTGRHRFIAFRGAFHGRTYGSVTLTASKPIQKRGFGPLLPGVDHARYSNPYRCPIHPQEEVCLDPACLCAEDIEQTLFAQTVPAQEVAAIIVEPIQGEGGYIVPSPAFLPRLRQLCDKYGILLVADEVQSGIGRTGKWFATEHWGVQPDIVCIAKGIASGMPLGAVIARKSLMVWPSGAHGNTYGGNPICCAASLATIRLIQDGFMHNAADVGAYTLTKLQEMAQVHPSIGHVRGRGLMIGVEFVDNRGTKHPAHDLRNAAVHAAFELGLLTLGCGENVIRICPPLSISRELIDEGLHAFDQAVSEAEAEFLR